MFDLHGRRGWMVACVESSDDAINGKSLDTIVRSWNAGATRMFGYSEDEIVGRSILLLIPLALRAQELDLLARVTQGQPIDNYETQRLRKDGTTIDVSVSISPIVGQSGEIIGASKIVREIKPIMNPHRGDEDQATPRGIGSFRAS
jgi:PAS domain S-box-containing protein